MTDHEKLKALMDRYNIGRKELAECIGLKESSVKNQLAPGSKVKKELPTWAKSMLLIAEKFSKLKGDN